MFVYTKPQAVLQALFMTTVVFAIAVVVSVFATGLIGYFLHFALPLAWNHMFWIATLLNAVLVTSWIFHQAEIEEGVPYMATIAVICIVPLLLSYDVRPFLLIGTSLGLFVQSLKDEWFYVDSPLNPGPPPLLKR